jgi:energy-coupling factor transporter ATP-binding protein EcfA2
MFEDYQICPYTGLRSFTEEESLYFKGREDDIDQATSQLQKNKFLMLTGASGDGKSSLIYAGIIPNARSGFLKSKYTQWCVADFRPERTPFQNLCNAVARQLDIANPYTVQSELNHGFSALADLYRNSKRYIDPHSVAWQLADEKEKAVMKREAANLIILVDQFEEFFTNPENYQHGVPSKDANLVLNLLLETARIAYEEDIPIYVVFTMRSDYIGQCAAFRGLPEYLGFSQFFVPRLNRSQLQQVIEEPARLSGNKISRRLTERLIHDITEGVDQLPILQHALNQIWGAADHGKEEMDLIHYAMVGGMSVNELPDEQVKRFNQWFNALPHEIKVCYHKPSLQNVLDTHTNKLFEQAAGYYTDKTSKPISREDAKMIIRTTFTCLTKIDQSRAVRNRMTLQEITNILSHPAYDASAVGTVLNIFREPGNTFIHPFITDDNPESQILQADHVLDITHESLIRNWQYLGQWAREEYDSHSVSVDFEQQLGRWVNSGKSNSFLLSIGPLTYFEGWFNKAKPNTWWIARYLPEETTKETKLDKANEILGNARDFLKRSASKHAITRTVMRYGPKRIAAAFGILAMLGLTSFAVRNYFIKQNASVLNSIQQQTLKLSDNPKVTLINKVTLICEEMKLGRTNASEAILAVREKIQQVNIANGIASLLIFQGEGQPAAAINRSLSIADSLLETFNIEQNNPDSISLLLKEINDLRSTIEMGYMYTPSPQMAQWRKRNAMRAARWVMKIAEQQPEGFHEVQEFTVALENSLNNQALSKEEINKLLRILSPFENSSLSPWMQVNFQQDKILIRGEVGYGFNFNGLYQELAYLYAASGNSDRALQCIDTLLKYSQNNFQGDYSAGADNASNIASVFFSNGTVDKLDAFVSGYCTRKKISEEEFYTAPGMNAQQQPAWIYTFG